ncbi:MAG: 3-deoxy-D-manno-octulosonic acid kinase [Gammaproteobacteria bacterium]|nr:3-deoxy-D-manno-octulosonic acid kinase [Gammaproteobacteria bacterium]
MGLLGLKKQHIVQQYSLSTALEAKHFEVEYWLKQVDSVALTAGRGSSVKFELDEHAYVLRNFLRGGLIAKLFYDQYLWFGEYASRAYQESRVIQYAIDQQVPVAPCIAYCIEKQGLFYRQSIITKFIENQGTLADVLQRQALTQTQWTGIAKVIIQLHQALINHADLNANNILLDDQWGAHIIDFDKATIMTDRSSWCDQNLQRLKRSLDKLKPTYYDQQQWKMFLTAYK